MREGLFVARRQREVAAPAAVVYQMFARLGGARGWLYANWLWQLRGFLDYLIGGPGMRRGRAHPDEAHAGDIIDFWQVEDVAPGTLLRLRAQMKVPGPAWLQFEAHPLAQGSTRLIQTASFAPRGILGRLYWYLLYPIHSVIFSGLIRKLARQAEDAFRQDQQAVGRPARWPDLGSRAR
jgi:hypothetical protein